MGATHPVVPLPRALDGLPLPTWIEWVAPTGAESLNLCLMDSSAFWDERELHGNLDFGQWRSGRQSGRTDSLLAWLRLRIKGRTATVENIQWADHLWEQPSRIRARYRRCVLWLLECLVEDAPGLQVDQIHVLHPAETDSSDDLLGRAEGYRKTVEAWYCTYPKRLGFRPPADWRPAGDDWKPYPESAEEVWGHYPARLELDLRPAAVARYCPPVLPARGPGSMPAAADLRTWPEIMRTLAEWALDAHDDALAADSWVGTYQRERAAELRTKLACGGDVSVYDIDLVVPYDHANPGPEDIFGQKAAS